MIINNTLCMLLHTKVYLYIYMQGFHHWTCCHGCGGHMVCLGAGNAPHKLISNTVNVLLICLHFMVKFYDDAIFLLVYIIIGRHTYHDVRAMHGQMAMYVLKHFMCQCLLYVKVTEKTHNEFHITMIITVYNCSVT